MSTKSCPTCQNELPDDAAFCAQCGSATATQIFGDTLAASPSGPSASYESEPERLQQILGPNYELGRLIGRGGYAEVFAVRDLKLQRELAIKVLRPDLIVTPNLLARFRREALAVAALNNPHIVPVYDVGEAGGVCYIVMPLVQGDSLKEVLARDGKLPVEEATRILLEASAGLAASHEAGVVHRDIKPENIILEGQERRVRLMDFGIAKAMDEGDRGLTGTGVVVGTPHYMSPEQASGESGVDRRTDQYSLAVVGYQMLGGRVPFGGETARAVITKLLLEKAPRLDRIAEGLPPTLVATLHRALDKDPARRFVSIQDFAAALQGHLSPNAGLPPIRRSRRGAWVAGSAVVALAAVAAASALFSGDVRQGESPPTPPPQPPAVTPPPIDTGTTRAALPPPPAPQPTPLATLDTPPDSAAAPPAQGPSDSVPVVFTPPVDCETAYGRQDWAVARSQCRAEAEAGGATANRRMAALIAAGRAGPIDQTEVARYYEAAALGGDAVASFEMGTRYSSAIGVPRDPTLATTRYLAAAKADYQPAFVEVARRYEIGLGVVKDERQAAVWYERAAEAGEAASQAAIAAMYADGRGVGRDQTRAKYWYEQAAIQDDREAQYQLAMIYFRGRGTRRSDEAGMDWLRRAASAGHAEAQRELDRRTD